MDKSKATICYLNMEAASNGAVISWSEKTQSSDKGTYDNVQWVDKKEVYDEDEDGDEDGLEKAFSRFKELWMKQYNDMKS